MTPSGIEPATFRFVAQHLNHCATAVPQHKPGSETIRGSHSCELVERKIRDDNKEADGISNRAGHN